jgi:hypothetical protein
MMDKTQSGDKIRNNYRYPADILPPEKIAFIAYNIGVYESVQKFRRLITSGKITNSTDVSKVAELLSDSIAFYDAEKIVLEQEQ